MKKLAPILQIPLVIVGVPIFYAMFWWSEHINGVEPKSGQRRLEHKTTDGQQYYRQAGLKHKFDKWKPVPESGMFDSDINSMYPSEIHRREF